MQSINCFIIVVAVLLCLTIKKLMLLFLYGTIALYKIQHHCRAFATDIAQNTVEMYPKIQ